MQNWLFTIKINKKDQLKKLKDTYENSALTSDVEAYTKELKSCANLMMLDIKKIREILQDENKLKQMAAINNHNLSSEDKRFLTNYSALDNISMELEEVSSKLERFTKKELKDFGDDPDQMIQSFDTILGILYDIADSGKGFRVKLIWIEL